MNAAIQTSPSKTPQIVIIGSGFGGLCMAIQLKKAGIDNFTILEKASSVGGTWRDNDYPGAASDVQSHLYSYSFAPKSDWSRKFGSQQEIRGYMEDCVKEYGLAPHLLFNTEVVAASFDQKLGLWIIETTDGDVIQSQVLVTASGQLNRPAFPKLKGIENFKGKVFHSARWEHDYDLNGKNVAVIGTGASAIQFVPQIVSKVKNLKLFQRSGAWVIAKPDRAFNKLEQKLFANFPIVDRAYRASIYWKNESRALGFTRFGKVLQVFSLEARLLALRHIRDADKRKKIIPDYMIGCKRILISNDWYPAINQKNLDLITDNIASVEADAIITQDGKRHIVDTIIYGTGFQTTDFLAPMRVTGLNGLDLNDAWRDGAQAYKGMCVSGFPNLFMLYGPNTNLAHSSIIIMLEAQVNYAKLCIQALNKTKMQYMDVKPERLEAYSISMQTQLKKSVWDSGCTSWYKHESGKNTANWPGFTFSYKLITSTLNLKDYHLQRGSKQPSAIGSKATPA